MVLDEIANYTLFSSRWISKDVEGRTVTRYPTDELFIWNSRHGEQIDRVMVSVWIFKQCLATTSSYKKVFVVLKLVNWTWTKEENKIPMNEKSSFNLKKRNEQKNDLINLLLIQLFLFAYFFFPLCNTFDYVKGISAN